MLKLPTRLRLGNEIFEGFMKTGDPATSVKVLASEMLALRVGE
ncbi:MAG: hypothetical protein O6945_05575 [Gammaproteobacteria bacterium]|nr:hypothetical protein [Gammaproteobacteria bacterium]